MEEGNGSMGLNDGMSINSVMYNDDGTFRPFVGNHGNISGDIADQRNTYMEAEREYFSFLLSDDKIREYIFYLLNNEEPEDIFYKAMQLQEQLENGELESEADKLRMASMTPEHREQYHLSILESAEAMMCLLFGAVRDKALVLDEIYHWNERLSQVDQQSRGSR